MKSKALHSLEKKPLHGVDYAEEYFSLPHGSPHTEKE